MNLETRIQHLKHLEIYFKNQGWSGNELLDFLEIIDDLIRYGIEINHQGEAGLFHATSDSNAKQIIEEQSMFALEDGLFFSTSPCGEIEGYGTTILKVWIPIPSLELNDDFRTEKHYRVPVRPYKKYPFRIEEYAKKEN